MLRKYVLCLAGLSLLLVVSFFLIQGWPRSAASDEWEQIDPENIEIIFAPNGEPLIADEAYQLTTHAGYVRNAIYYSKAQIFAYLSYGKVGHGTYYRETSLEPKRLLGLLNEPAPSNISNSKTVNSHFGSAKYITFEHDSNDCFATTVFWLLYANGYRRALDIVYCRQLGGPIDESGIGSILSGIGITGEKEPPSLTVTRAVRPEAAVQRREEEKRQYALWATADLLAEAQCGDAHAQSVLGYRYQLGWGVVQNFARAYFWYGIAHTGGVGRPPREKPQLSGRITPDQIAEAERLMAEWKPKDCTAEEIASPND